MVASNSLPCLSNGGGKKHGWMVGLLQVFSEVEVCDIKIENVKKCGIQE